MKMKKMRAGIVGCGGIAHSKHLPAIKKLGLIDMVAFCDLIEERARKTRDEFGTEDALVFTDYKELLKLELDAVYVTTPNREHSFITIDALKAGKNVLCEKPMAKTYKEALEMVEAARATGKILTVGYQNRYRPECQYLKRVCSDGGLGEIYFAKAHALRRRAVPTWGVFLNEEEQGGGALIDIGTHALDLTLWMMDNYEPVSVVGSVYKKLAGQREQANAWGEWDPEKFTVEDSAFGFVKMSNGATVAVEAAWALNTLDVDEAKTSLCGTKAGADMKDGLRINRVQYNRQVVEQPRINGAGQQFYDASRDNPDVLEQETFYNAVMNGGEVVIKPEQALVVTRILEAIYESGKTGEMIVFDK